MRAPVCGLLQRNGGGGAHQAVDLATHRVATRRAPKVLETGLVETPGGFIHGITTRESLPPL